MDKFIFMMVILFGCFWNFSAWGGGGSDTLGSYDCLEVEKFRVDRENYSTHELERAATISENELEVLQHKIVGEVTRKSLFEKVTKAGKSSCGAHALIFGGQVTDYKKGDRTARILIGFGAGKQKFEVQCYLKDKKTGEILAKREIVDRKWAGVAGGDEDAGKTDFAEAIAKFIKNGK